MSRAVGRASFRTRAVTRDDGPQPGTWSPRVGAWPAADGWYFCVWAPRAARVDLVIPGRPERPLMATGTGYFTARFPDLQPGDLYAYRVDGAGPYPDPASRAQPDGVHGPSQLVDPRRYHWTDAAWRGVALEDAVVYELHVGTFTPEGTFAGVAARLPILAELGVTLIELMPVAAFAGRRNWGYDGAALFAPAATYGEPDDLRRLVDAAHRLGIGVLLDVVYNHFGPAGAYHKVFAPDYATSAPGPWGEVPDLRGPRHEDVRTFFVDNALHWLHEYHLDGLRLDATHTFVDEGTRPFLDQLVAEVRAGAPRPVLLIAEDDRNERRLVTPPADGGAGLDAVWADDLHHQLRVAVAGDRDGYYAAYTGWAADVADTIAHGWFYRGRRWLLDGPARGTPTDGIPRPRFVCCLQNHDQVGNRPFGDRLHHAVDAATWRALSLLLCCLPETPLLFMGQEWAAGTPFLYFTDHDRELGAAIDRGRRREFARFTGFASTALPSTQAAETFTRSRLDWSEREREPHAAVWRLYRDAIRWRRAHVVRRLDAAPQSTARALDAHTVVVEGRGRDGRPYACICRWGAPGEARWWPSPLVEDRGGGWTVALSSEDEAFVGDGPARPIRVAAAAVGYAISFARPGTVVLIGDEPAKGVHESNTYASR